MSFVLFKCKERNEVMNGASCYQCWINKDPAIRKFGSRVLCKNENQLPTNPAELPADAIQVSQANVGQYYKISNNILVKVEKIEKDKNKVRLLIEETGTCIEVPSTTVVFSDISKLLSDKGYEKKTSKLITAKDRRRGERKETKTSYIDKLLLEGTEFAEIVKLVIEKFEEDEKKIKRLVWSRRATLKPQIEGT